MSEFGRFFVPGPTEVRPEILAAQARPMIGHRGEEMKALMAGLQPGLRALFRTERPVYISTSSATGLMEAAVRNGGRGRVLALVNGAFSERFAVIARSVGLEVDELAVPWGEHHEPDQVAERLRTGGHDAVTVVHSETSTGVLNPVREIAQVAHAHDAIVLVDAVSSMAGAPVETDAWQLDFVLTGSQKALALPPGISFGVAQPSMLERARESTRRGVYFDLLEFEEGIQKHQTPGTPAIAQIFALERQLRDIERETLEARWQRHRDMARRTWSWVEAMHGDGVDLRVLAAPGYRSTTVTCVRMPDDRGALELIEEVRRRGFVLAPGYGPEKDTMFRIGHMGDHTLAQVEAVLDAAADALRRVAA